MPFFLKINLISSSVIKDGISKKFDFLMAPEEISFLKSFSSIKSNESFFFFAVNDVKEARSEIFFHLLSSNGIISFLKKFLSKSLFLFVLSSMYGRSFKSIYFFKSIFGKCKNGLIISPLPSDLISSGPLRPSIPVPLNNLNNIVSKTSSL